MTLVDKAREVTGEGDSDDELALALAWMRGEVDSRQAAHALSMSVPSNVAYTFGAAIRKAVRAGKIKIVTVSP